MKKPGMGFKKVKAPKVNTVKAPKSTSAKVNSAGMKRIKSTMRGI